MTSTISAGTTLAGAGITRYEERLKRLIASKTSFTIFSIGMWVCGGVWYFKLLSHHIAIVSKMRFAEYFRIYSHAVKCALSFSIPD